MCDQTPEKFYKELEVRAKRQLQYKLLGIYLLEDAPAGSLKA
jgi:hypothetical protein